MILIAIIGTLSILLTLSVYYIVFSLTIFLLNKFLVYDKAKTARLFVASVFIILLSGELSLRYLTKSDLFYPEKNNDFFYPSIYGNNAIETFFRKNILGQTNTDLLSHIPFSKNKITKPEFAYEHRYNNLGLRGDTVLKDTSAFNIIVLGDSFVEGVGVPEDSTLGNLLNDLLIEVYKTKKLRVINAGINGSNPVSSYFLLKKTLLELNPNIVILIINNSDIIDIILKGGTERFNKSKNIQKPWWEFFYNSSYIVRRIVHGFLDYNWLLIPNDKMQERSKEAINLIIKIVENDFRQLANDYSFKLVIATLPMQYELETSDFTLNDFCQKLFFKEEIQCINLYKEINSNKIEITDFSELYWQVDLHNNSKGQLIWAKIISDQLNLEFD